MKHAFGFTETPIESGILILLTLILGFLTGWFRIILIAYLVAGLIRLIRVPVYAPKSWNAYAAVCTTRCLPTLAYMPSSIRPAGP